jgi:hypothetical protein
MMTKKFALIASLALVFSVCAFAGQNHGTAAPVNQITADQALTGVVMQMSPNQLPDQFSTQLRDDVSKSTGTAILKQKGNDIEYSFTWKNLTSPVISAHFHYGPHDQVGSRAYSICGVANESPACPSGTENGISGVWKNADVAAVKTGDIVIAFHTAKYPAPIGELAVYIPAEKTTVAKVNQITGEVALTGVPMPMSPNQLPDQFSTQLRDDVSKSTGVAILKQNGKDIEYSFSWKNLTSPVISAHFHYGPHDQVGSRAYSICGVANESPACPAGKEDTISGTWKNADIAAVKAGDIVIAFHTAKYPAPIGELAVYIPAEKTTVAKANHITGDVALTGVTMQMSPDQLPDQFSTQLRDDVSKSTGTAVLKQVGKDVEYTFSWKNLTSSVISAHFHYGPHDQVGSRAYSICGVANESPACPEGKENTITGVWKNADVAAVKAGDIVIAFHTQKYPAPIGELAVYIPAANATVAAASHTHVH